MSIFEFDAEREWKLIREAERGAGYEEGMAEGIEQGIVQGTIISLNNLVKKGLLSVEIAAEQAGITVQEF